MPLNSMELERAGQRLADLQRRLNAGKGESIEELQREIVLLTDVVASMLHVLDRALGEIKRSSR